MDCIQWALLYHWLAHIDISEGDKVWGPTTFIFITFSWIDSIPSNAYFLCPSNTKPTICVHHFFIRDPPKARGSFSSPLPIIWTPSQVRYGLCDLPTLTQIRCRRDGRTRHKNLPLRSRAEVFVVSPPAVTIATSACLPRALWASAGNALD